MTAGSELLSRDPPARRPFRRLILGTSGSIAGTVYGTIVVMGAITAGSGHGLEAAQLAATVVATVLVLWLAHVYSDSLGEAIGRGRRLDRAELLSVGRRELAIPLAACVPAAMLVLGALSVLREATAVWLALIICLVTLAVQGIRYSQLERLSTRWTVFSVALNLSLGLVIVLLKALVVH